MRKRMTRIGMAIGLAAAVCGAPAAHAVTAAPGWTLGFVETPGPATGDVVAANGALFVGVGGFGVGAQQVVRIDGDGVRVLAEGFNSLAGFAYDPTNDRLVVGDNGGDLPGATTGDTVYAITDPFGDPAVPAAAASLELLPSGSVPGLSDVIFDPTDPSGDRLLVGDASEAFPVPEGRLLEVTIGSGTSSVLRSDLLFTAGLAEDGTSVFLGDLELDFSGRIREVSASAPGGDASPFASGLPGQFDLEIAPDGSLLSTSGDVLLAFDTAGGTPETIASGFGFATGLAVDGDGVVYALDGFAAAGDLEKIWVLTPVPEASVVWLVGAGVLGVMLGGRRRERGAPARSSP